jgi:hypothetical protein
VPFAAFSRFFSRGVDADLRLTEPLCKKKFPPSPIFFAAVPALRRRERRARAARKPRLYAAMRAGNAGEIGLNRVDGVR